MILHDKHLVTMLPHGVDETIFRPMDPHSNQLKDMRNRIGLKKHHEFVVLFNGRNMNRKRVMSLLLGFREFCEELRENDRDKCALLLKTEKVCDMGTDLPAAIEAICPGCAVIFDNNYQRTRQEMAIIYNLASVVACVSSSEGFGISQLEAMLCGVPTITASTGGLNDQQGGGEWCSILQPVSRVLFGSPVTPYIFDDVTSPEQIRDALLAWRALSPSDRKKRGLAGREWALSNGFRAADMVDKFAKTVDFTLANFKPEPSFKLIDSRERVGHQMRKGISLYGPEKT